jgi:DNA-binding MarR family transcriptional regulator
MRGCCASHADRGRCGPLTEHEQAGRTGDRETMESLLSADLRALMAQSDRIGRIFAETHGLSANEFHALLHIMVGESTGAVLSAGELQQRIGLTQSGITHLVDRMITAGHIRRDADPTDRRKVILRYEDHGMEVARAFFVHVGAANRQALAGMSDQELASAHKVMQTLTASMDQISMRLLDSDDQQQIKKLPDI